MTERTNLFRICCVCALMLLCLNSGQAQNPDTAIPGNRVVELRPDSVRLLRNPLTGWVVYGSLGRGGDFWSRYDHIECPEAPGGEVRVSDYAQTLYLRTSWAVLNPSEGVYAWQSDSALRRLLDGARKRGMQLAFRVVVDGRDRGRDATPGYVREAGASGFYARGRWSPYPDDKVFQRCYEQFIAAFAAEFNDPEKTAFIDGFGLGKWGEYHTLIYSSGDEKPRREVFDWVTDLYSKAFDRVPVVINYHRWIGTGKDWIDDATFDPQSEQMLESAIAKGYALRHDAFGMTTYYGTWERAFAKKWNFRRPIIMEGGWIVGGTHRYWQDPRGYRPNTPGDVRRGEFEDSREAFVNMMDLRVGETDSWFRDEFSLVKRFIAKGGYRLWPDRISLPQTLVRGEKATIRHRWNNMGWGYCPTDLPQWNQKYKVAFALLDSRGQVQRTFTDTTTDLSTWRAGTPTEYLFVPDLSGVAPGRYTWAVGLVDTTRQCAVGLEIAVADNVLPSGWVPLTEVSIKR